MSATPLNCGYVPLVDCAPLIIAKELGFAEQNGITLNLLRQPSWAALRDLLALGHLDAAHMLSPMPVAMSLGLSGQPVDVIAPLVMSVNGTILGVSSELAKALRAVGWTSEDTTPHTFLDGLSRLLGPIRVGVPFPYSMHRLLFEYLVADGPEDLRARSTIITTPPPLMADAVAAGEIDVFAVGEPWGTLAAYSGSAELVMPGASIWAHAPEKVLGMRAQWAQDNPDQARALVRTIYEACEWLGTPENHPLASEILSRSDHLNLPDHTIDPSLSGLITPVLGAAPWHVPNFLRFGGSTTCFPWRSFGAWVGDQLSRHEGGNREAMIKQAAACFRSDLFRAFLANSKVDMPGASAKIEGSLAHATAVASTRGTMILERDAFFDGKTFDFPKIF